MRGIYKYLIYATIPLAFAMAGVAAAIGATFQGLVMWLMLAVSIGAFVYVFVVLKLLDKIEYWERVHAAQLKRERKMMLRIMRDTYRNG